MGVSFLSELSGTGATPTVLAYHASVAHPTDTMDTRIDKASMTDAFPHLVLGLVLTST